LIELGNLIKEEEKEAEKVDGYFAKRSAKKKTESKSRKFKAAVY
jgi:hypothetical protein